MRILLMGVTLLVVGAGEGVAQVSAGMSWLEKPRADMPGGPGAWLRLEWVTNRFVRLEALGGRDWGRETRLGTLCDEYWPLFLNCTEERAERKNTASRLEGHIVTLTPQLAGLRVGIGGGLAMYDFDVSHTGLTTGRTESPASTDTDGAVPSFAVVAEYSPSFLRGLKVDVRGQMTSVDFGTCVQDSWDVCGTESLRRLLLGVGYRF